MLVISGTGGGVRINFSPIRPRGTPIRGTGGEATGAVSLMEVINQTGEVINRWRSPNCSYALFGLQARRHYGVPTQEVQQSKS